MINKKAYAKINLTLELTGKLSNGYHSVCTLMHKISLCDDIKLSLNNSKSISVKANLDLCDEKDNLAYRAAALFLEAYNKQHNTSHGADIIITKRIPAGAGLGGGSSDGACVLDCLNELLHGFEQQQLEQFASALGADVPFALENHSFCYATGTGTTLCDFKKITYPCHVAVIKPRIFCGTKDMYNYYDQNFRFSHANNTKDFIQSLTFPKSFEYCCNDFEKAAFSLYPDIKSIVQKLNSFNPYYAGMTGSGSAIFAIFENKTQAELALEQTQKEFFEITENTFIEKFV